MNINVYLSQYTCTHYTIYPHVDIKQALIPSYMTRNYPVEQRGELAQCCINRLQHCCHLFNVKY